MLVLSEFFSGKFSGKPSAWSQEWVWVELRRPLLTRNFCAISGFEPFAEKPRMI